MLLLPWLSVGSYTSEGMNSKPSSFKSDPNLLRSGIVLAAASALVSTLRLISCREDKMMIFSFVLCSRGYSAKVVVARARLKLEDTITEVSLDSPIKNQENRYEDEEDED